MTLSVEERQQIRLKGFAYIGGLQKNRYWTPDGREILAVPSMRTFNRIVEGKITDSGIRDANLDNGWLTEKPQTLKPHCPHCGKWHDTQAEIDTCGSKRSAFQKKYDKLAQKEKMKEFSEVDKIKEDVDALKSDMTDIKMMLVQLLKKE